MRSFITMRAVALIAMVAVSFTATGCATSTSTNRSASADTIEGAYLVANFPGIPAIGNRPAVQADTFGPDQFRQIQHLDQQCHAQLDPYIPSIVNDILVTGLRTAVPTAIGGALGTGFGAVQAFTGVTFGQYAKYAAASTGGSAFGSGVGGALGARSLAVRYVQYACMQGFVSRAQQKNELKGTVIVPWAGPTNARPFRMPAGQSSSPSASSTPSVIDANEEQQSLTPPLPLP